MMKLPPLRALQCFESVARLNSFSKAAEILNVTQSAVSHQVKLLEEYFGESMFDRQGRSFSLTTKGKEYFDEINRSLTDISNASKVIQNGKSGNIRLALYSSVAVNWLIPRLEDFRNQYPEIELTLNMVGGNPDHNDSSSDCFITVAPPKSNFVKQLLFTEELYPVCGEKLWQKVKDKPLPDALWQHPLLSVRYLNDNENLGDDWKLWCSKGEFKLPENVKINQFSHVLLATEAARYNLGVALINNYITFEQNLKQNLVRIPMHSLFTGDSFYFVYKQSLVNQPDIIKLSRWLKKQCDELQLS